LDGADLSDAKCRGACLARAIARGVRAAGADFSWSDLGWSYFNRADLSGVRAVRTDFTGADLSNATFGNAQLHEAHFNEARLQESHFGQAHLGRTIFTGCDLSSAHLDETIHFGRCYVGVETLERTAAGFAQNGRPHAEFEGFLRRAGMNEHIVEDFRSTIGRPVPLYSVFISYSRADREFADFLYDYLQRRGIRCWLDEHQLVPGDELYDAINNAIRIWDKVLLCCSQASLNSWWVDNELVIAFEREQQAQRDGRGKVPVLIPLDLDGYLFEWQGGKAPQIRQRVAAAFTEWREPTERFWNHIHRLLQALGSGASSR
jgi:hypothetical protein